MIIGGMLSVAFSLSLRDFPTQRKTGEEIVDVVGGDDVGEEIVNGGTKNGSILFPNSKTGDASSSFLERVRNSVAENGPKLREASERTGREILLWTRRSSSLRALLVITMGTIFLLTTMALVVFTLFFVAATANAIIISLLISLAVAGGFLAFFFLCLTGIASLIVAAPRCSEIPELGDLRDIFEKKYGKENSLYNDLLSWNYE
ncbi:unnamed protein product [Arabidopsis lyrata]|nr:unnamed protein product [Arabidopsis lyrata]